MIKTSTCLLCEDAIRWSSTVNAFRCKLGRRVLHSQRNSAQRPERTLINVYFSRPVGLFAKTGTFCYESANPLSCRLGGGNTVARRIAGMTASLLARFLANEYKWSKNRAKSSSVLLERCRPRNGVPITRLSFRPKNLSSLNNHFDAFGIP